MTRSPSNARPTSNRNRLATRPQVESLEGRLLLTAGDLDLSFGVGGSVLTSPSADSKETGNDFGHAVEVLGDGSILIASTAHEGDSEIGLVRLTPSGSLDSQFGSGGRVMTSIWSSGGEVSDMAILPGGKILVAGSMYKKKGTTLIDSDFALVRFNPNGTLDTSFGASGTGLVTTSINTTGDYAFALTIQSDGRILVAGRTWGSAGTNADSAVIRYNPSGTLDLSFGVGGKAVIHASPNNDNFNDVISLPDGKILLTSATWTSGGTGNGILVGLDSSGNLDSTFGQGGLTATSFRVSTNENGLLATVGDGQGGYRIVAAGYLSNGANNDIALARFLPDGTLDPSFGSGGSTTADAGYGDVPTAAQIQPDGAIVVVGRSDYTKALVARFSPSGVLDSSFGNGGITINSFTTPGKIQYFSDLAIQTNGMIVAVGSAVVTTVSKRSSYDEYDVLIARFEGNSAPLLATSVALDPVKQSLTAAQLRPALAQALALWRARGANTSRLGRIDLAIADLGGDRLGEASGSTITLDDNAAGWGWNVGRAAGRGRKAGTGRMDLLSALVHEVGHLLGHDHAEGGVMAERLAPGVRQARPVTPSREQASTIAERGPMSFQMGAFSIRPRGVRARIGRAR